MVLEASFVPAEEEMSEYTTPRKYTRKRLAGTVYLIYYRVRSKAALEQKETRCKALVGSPAGEEEQHLFSPLNDAIELRRAHACVLVDVAGECRDLRPRAGQRFELFVDKRGDVGPSWTYYVNDDVDRFLKWQLVGRIPAQPYRTPVVFAHTLLEEMENILSDMIGEGPNTWGIELNCQAFAFRFLTKLLGPHAWPETFPHGGQLPPWIVSLYVRGHSSKMGKPSLERKEEPVDSDSDDDEEEEHEDL